ncbi:MAG: addiction module toxin, HicA family [Candidatus Taylorbacteria bacterium RIFCSPHIGHO2_02_49_25]|uniref:Addiction module toxin, HicA family n=1 Tax=Candidatus Taylorbacteria bacterium RIFCSPHIGHO2_02_49_25 TaxID=1802305 RepID=A0A1G2MD51_9BACT|nr:MAG: addiction module toxin, HicA family [Candidatus Taylorbacteria bacterium RIFCSPHIGHO2_01_FULL_49_60]OHA21644.1 MAG: addiction module toxin, HicA family [Candidatus Taylorbacteria bacterium RIFCSPHIGHO2_02_49_25]OHA36983.1 MAG: addiction module toxin, HicA family [Candidatus Taylorbacteria bacterium RIFCSPLOWO2_01_FULL_50_130]OHA37187.1 MAG: addiction module toxin, HicA family [Candidatus Taylorbacteria bacterium RIFCSPLOWO2_02_50_13]OHA40043.1 MAG: addiction module toxin, HicA family [C
MKRPDLLAYLRKHGCVFIKEGAKHSLFFNPAAGRFSTVPRHNDIDSFLALKICKDLGIPKIDKR